MFEGCIQKTSYQARLLYRDSAESSPRYIYLFFFLPEIRVNCNSYERGGDKGGEGRESGWSKLTERRAIGMLCFLCLYQVSAPGFGDWLQTACLHQVLAITLPFSGFRSFLNWKWELVQWIVLKDAFFSICFSFAFCGAVLVLTCSLFLALHLYFFPLKWHEMTTVALFLNSKVWETVFFDTSQFRTK